MTTDNLENWGNSIIDKVNEERTRLSEKRLEFSIFYSPLRANPKLMIIGDNPGGQMEQAQRCPTARTRWMGWPPATP